MFLDTDAVLGAREEAAAEAVRNKGEAALLLRVATALVGAGLPDSAIGAISPYRSQVWCWGAKAPPTALGFRDVECAQMPSFKLSALKCLAAHCRQPRGRQGSSPPSTP